MQTERYSGYEDPKNEPYPDVDDYFDRLVEEGIINNKDEDVVDNGDDTYEVTTKEEHVFKVTETEDEIIIDYIGEANRLGPTITNIEVKNKTTNSIEIEVIGQRLKDVTYTYEYKKEGESEWKTAGTTEENTHIYTGLEANEIYNIRVKVENKRESLIFFWSICLTAWAARMMKLRSLLSGLCEMELKFGVQQRDSSGLTIM